MDFVPTRPTTTMFLLRHAEAEGWGLSDGLTIEGAQASEALVPVFQSLEIDGVFTSPAIRARETVQPFADAAGLALTTLPDLREHQTSLQGHIPDDALIERRFKERNLSRPGGESFNDAATRLRNAIKSLSRRPVYAPLLSTHGGLIASVMSALYSDFGYDQFLQMPRPALFKVTHNHGTIREIQPLTLP
ncbi:histidine phosphatase family protein [Cognatishimia sp. MH4019]|uniref:histidine phosphatase family protein n=1 Tax=Cognatishimia sp. MH4019 TaxID=2854030 RepID=UPI001CD809E8|nr:histidine phosphatase family protein [Cognatishimia sp. MH4019]